MPIQPFPVVLAIAAALAVPAAAEPVRIIALGDSLTAGYGLAAEEAFPAQLEAALRARGHDVVIVNAGVSGDTASDGLARLDWAVGEDADGVIVEFGANDALRGVSPQIARDALDQLLARLVDDRGLPVLLAGMMAPRNLGSDYASEFDAIYPDLAERYGAILYPFFLDGVATDRALNQPDGIHPTAEGVAVIVERILPAAEELVEQAVGKIRAGALQPLTAGPILSMIRDGGAPCRVCSPASKSPPRSASDWRSSEAGFPAPAG